MKQTVAGDLKRDMGLGSAIILVVASMVGTGIFTTPGFIIEEVGSSQALLFCWLIGGMFALAGALCYGELGAMMPEAGGEYVYLRHCFGPFWAFMSGWISLIVGFSAPIAAAAIAFATYFTGGKSDIWFSMNVGAYRMISFSPTILLAIAAVVVLSFVHYHSVGLGKRVQNILTTFKLGFLLVYIGFTLSLISMLTVAGLIRLRMTRPDLPRPYRTFGYPLTPLVFIAGNLGIIAYSFANRPVAAIYGLATLCAGGMAYTFFRKNSHDEH